MHLPRHTLSLVPEFAETFERVLHEMELDTPPLDREVRVIPLAGRCLTRAGCTCLPTEDCVEVDADALHDAIARLKRADASRSLYHLPTRASNRF